MRYKDATAPARVSAANAIQDRGWGKVPKAIQNGDDGAFELTQRIERVIVHPENSEDIRPSAKAIVPRGRRSLAMSLNETKFDLS
jgi:hypothetical protein